MGPPSQWLRKLFSSRNLDHRTESTLPHAGQTRGPGNICASQVIKQTSGATVVGGVRLSASAEMRSCVPQGARGRLTFPVAMPWCCEMTLCESEGG